MDRKKKILVVLARIDSGGNYTSVYNLIDYLGDEYDFFLLSINDSDNVIPKKCKFVRLNYKHETSLFGNIKKAVGIYLSILKIIKKERISILFEILPCDHMFSYVNFLGVKRIFSFRDFIQMEENMERHHRIVGCSSHVVFNSVASMEYYLKAYPNDANEVSTINNYVNFERIEYLKNEPLTTDYAEKIKDCFVFSTIGRLCQVKSQNKLIRAFVYLLNNYDVDTCLIIIGGGDLEQKLKSMAAESKHADKIIIVGNQSNPYKILNNSDVYVCSSLSEGFPNGILEAMACGLPVVSVNCMTGPLEILSDDLSRDIVDITKAEYGIILPAFKKSDSYKIDEIQDDEILLAKAMYLIYSEPKLADEYSKLSINRIKKFKTDRISLQWKETFENV